MAHSWDPSPGKTVAHPSRELRILHAMASVMSHGLHGHDSCCYGPRCHESCCHAPRCCHLFRLTEYDVVIHWHHSCCSFIVPKQFVVRGS